ncbi:hypothetical protein [Sandaracinus amylolyticus]|uniref:DUF3999 family protein n=1 Tax=Sandaracinus amylolyticus TaxID=927083 RepID=A0A0F6W2J2_9BACT|nr:hypothetical protein [Sandaracinus amylolyticus]AKF05856.1 hypothetical protein DB32_003005 [Sandaracinus amylolyticus]
MSSLRFLVIALAALVIAPSSGSAQATPPLARLFPHRATIDAPPGLVRLSPPAEVLLEARADLSDVRVLDRDDREVPFLVDRGERPVPQDAPREALAPVLDATREAMRVRGVTQVREVLTIETPSAPPVGATWVLRVSTARSRFVTRARLVWTQAPEGERDVARGALFRIGAPAREKLEIATSGLGRGRVRVELEGEDGYLEPTFVWLAVRDEPRASTLDVPLAITGTRHERGRTIVIAARPAGVTPERIVIGTRTASFVRRVDVTAIDAAHGRLAIASGTALRVPGVPGADERSLDVAAARGDRLEITIDDGDSPPLDALEITAVVRAPSLVFEGDRAAMLRFGGGRVRAPSYDLQRLFGTTFGEELLDRRLTGTATLGTIEREPGFVAGPALEVAMRAGARIDDRTYEHVATLTIPETRDGLAHVVLPADVLSAARTDLADLRIVDGDGAQRGYLLGDTAAPLDVALTARALDRGELEEGWSRVALDAPVERIAASAIELVTSAGFVEREVVIVGRGEDDTEIELARTWVSRTPGEDARPLVVTTRATRVRSLELRVHDGDEAPLAIESAIARVHTFDLFVTAPAGEYRVLAGAPDASAPRYEIQRARELVLAVRAGDASIGAVTRNPAWRGPGLFDRAGGETFVVWAVLILAVIVLAAVTLRVARSAPEPEREG